MTLTRSRVQFPAHAMLFCSSEFIVWDRRRSAPPCGGGCGQLASETGQSYPFVPLIPGQCSERRRSLENSPPALGSARTHHRRSGTLVPSLHLKFNACPLFQSVEVESLKAAAVEEYFLALGSADKPEPTITDDSLNSPLHGHLGKRMGIFALDRDKDGGRRVKSPHAPIGATLPPPWRVVKGQTQTKPIAIEVRGERVKKSSSTESRCFSSLSIKPRAGVAPAPSGCGAENRSPR